MNFVIPATMTISFILLDSHFLYSFLSHKDIILRTSFTFFNELKYSFINLRTH